RGHGQGADPGAGADRTRYADLVGGDAGRDAAGVGDAPAPGRPTYSGRHLGLAEALLPLTEERVREPRVWLAFLHWSVNDPELAAIHHRSASELREGLRDAIAGAQRTGEVAEASDPELEALALMTYIDGLTVEAVTTG